MPTFEDYYAVNPISVIDQNTWTDRTPEVIMNFQKGPTIYTPLIDWMDRSQITGAEISQFTELLEGDVDFDEIGMADQYILQPNIVDSRMRQVTTARYGDKVQLHETSNIFQQWKMSGGRDWRPLLRNVLGNNIRRKIEILSRNIFLKGPKSFWTYAAGATDFSELDADHTFDLGIINEWNLRLGNTGTPVIPGEASSVKVVIVPPGVVYDFFSKLAVASQNEAAMWRDAKLYQNVLQYEIGSFKNTRFIEVPNDNYGQNSAVLYNCGAIEIQAEVAAAIATGDGSPNPASVAVDDVWYVGQKNVARHYIQLEACDMTLFHLNDIVTIHTKRTSDFGVSEGVDPLSGKTVQRRVVLIDEGNHRLSFDRPIMKNYDIALDSGDSVYAYVTKAAHVGYCLVLGSRGGVMGNVNRPLKFYEPRPIDDFETVWRYVWDIIAGYNIWEPNLFECHFCAVSLPKPGGIISPPAGGS